MQTVVARNVCDMYADASQKERVSQAILGQPLEVTGETGDHAHVVTPDLYRGHVRKHAVVTLRLWNTRHLKRVSTLFAPVLIAPNKEAELLTTLVMSTVVPVVGSTRHYWRIVLPDETVGYVRKDNLGRTVKQPNRALDNGTVNGITSRAVAVSVKLVGTPYLWGGTTPYGIDCSGFTQLTYRMAGFHLLRDAYMQFADQRFEPVEQGKSFEEASLKAGDLVFFGTVNGATARVTHVGMILPDGRMVHSAGGFGVVIESREGHRLCAAYLGARRLKLNVSAAIAPHKS